MVSIAFNLGLFKIGWLAIVFSAAAANPVLGTAAAVAIVLIHLAAVKRSWNEVLLLLGAASLGFAWETLLVNAGLVSYPAALTETLAPYWIVALWMLFATTLNVGMRWLQNNVFITAIAGAISGPLSFFGGQKAGAVVIHEGGLLALSIGWAVLLPTITFLAAWCHARDERRYSTAYVPAEEQA